LFEQTQLAAQQRGFTAFIAAMAVKLVPMTVLYCPGTVYFVSPCVLNLKSVENFEVSSVPGFLVT
jgi:hypothetical protein